MKKSLILIIFFFLLNCSNSKVVYWCGDHACVNKKEKEKYFSETMTVEVKEIKNNRPRKKTGTEKIMQQLKTEENSLIKNVKSNSKKEILEDKELIKKLKLEEKRNIKEQKELAEQLRLEEKRRIKEEKELVKQLELEEKKRLKEE